LLSKRDVSLDTTIYNFGLPDGLTLQLPICACILMRAPGCGVDGSDVVRPYTPVSHPDTPGQFELLVKRYEGGAASQYLHNLPAGSSVEFKHIQFNVKVQYPFVGKKTITMVAAGTGITPMYQALFRLLETPGDAREVVLIYGSRTVEDILCRKELDAMARAHSRLKVVHVIGQNADDPPPAGWMDSDAHIAESGWIDRAKLEKYAFPPSEDTLLFVCGLPAMYDSLCGPRTEAELAEGSVLSEIGYTASMVAKM